MNATIQTNETNAITPTLAHLLPAPYGVNYQLNHIDEIMALNGLNK